jgi:hypothetical protein
MRDIRRKRHFSQTVQNLLEDPVIGKLNQTFSVFQDIRHFSSQDSFPE